MARNNLFPETGDTLDTSVLDGLIGYDVRRASLVLTDAFAQRMAPLGLGPVPFTLLLLISANPGIKGTHLCDLLDLHSSNLVGLIKQLGERGLIDRRPHPDDDRALGLHLTSKGEKVTRAAEAIALDAGLQATHRLSQDERVTLACLLRKIYRP